MFEINQMLVASRTKTYPGTNPCNYIVIHETANESTGANAKLHAKLQRNGFSASWHYSVGSDGVWQSFPDTVKCWHAGDGQYGKGNAQGIGIEICVNRDGDFKKTIANAVDLVKHLMKKHNIPVSNVIQHNVTSSWGKDCPHYLRSGKKGVTWAQFKQMLTVQQSAKKEGELTVLQYNELKKLIEAQNTKINAQAKEISALKRDKLNVPNANAAVDPAHKERWKWAKANGLLDGKNPAGKVTRQQLGSVEHNFYKQFIANDAPAEEYAKEALEWAADPKNNISDASNPAYLASRQQVITIVKRAFDLAAAGKDQSEGSTGE